MVAWGRDRDFLRVVADVAAAADRPLRVHSGGGAPLWGPLDTVIVEAESVPDLMSHLEGEAARPAAGPVVVAGRDGGSDPWAAASELSRRWGPPAVVVLPQGRAWLADRLALREEAPAARPRIGVVGASGGIGTSALALWLGGRLRGRGNEVVVVDAVPASVGLDACIAPRPLPGLRWEDLVGLPGLPEGAALLGTLPAAHGLPVLTSGSSSTAAEPGKDGTQAPEVTGGDLPPSASGALAPAPSLPGAAGTRPWDIATAFGGEAMTVIDLGTAAGMLAPGDAEGRWLSRCSAVVLLVPFTRRGLSQAREVRRRWAPLMPLVPVGVGPRFCDVTDAEAARILGERLHAVIPHLPSVYAAYEAGHLLEEGQHRALRRPLEDLADAVLAALGRNPEERSPAASGTAPPRHRNGRRGTSSARGERT
ncbi:hypothetical protein [Rothia halotolerans]|uniref:hypothetical protein n=1 Tax=Rothia halotolerans TaxID=405770 RepID=UPI00101E0F2D|nr:hypothetical protein [Rothia halotolerans]